MQLTIDTPYDIWEGRSVSCMRVEGGQKRIYILFWFTSYVRRSERWQVSTSYVTVHYSGVDHGIERMTLWKQVRYRADFLEKKKKDGRAHRSGLTRAIRVSLSDIRRDKAQFDDERLTMLKQSESGPKMFRSIDSSSTVTKYAPAHEGRVICSDVGLG